MLVNLLVQAGASVNCPDRRGNTCIHLAAQRKNVSVLQILSQAESHTPEYNARNFAGNVMPVLSTPPRGTIWSHKAIVVCFVCFCCAWCHYRDWIKGRILFALFYTEKCLLLIVNLLCYSISLCIASLPCSPPPSLSLSICFVICCSLTLPLSLSYSILHSLFPPLFPCFLTLPCI